MASNSSIREVVLAVVGSSLALACGGGSAPSGAVGSSGSPGAAGIPNFAGSSGNVGGAGSAGGNAGDTSSGGPVAVADDGKPFVPADIKYSLVDSGRALTLLSATLINDETGVAWFIAMRNDESVPLCIPQVDVAFIDSANPDSQHGQAVVMIEAPMYQSDAGVHPCLMPGAIGMGWQGASGFASAMPQISEIEYRPAGYLSPEAVKLADLALEGVMITNDPAGGKQVTGRVTNHGTSSAARPELDIFALDSGGRPFDAGYANSMTDLASGGSWSFEMNVPTPFNKYVAFPVWGQQ